MAYNDQQIRDYIQANNLGSNPTGIAAAQQSGLAGVSNSQLDGAMGWAPNTAQGWWDQQNQQHQQLQNNAQTFQANGQQGYGAQGGMTTQEQNLQTMQPQSFYGTGAGQMGPAGGAPSGGAPVLGGNPYAPTGGNPYVPGGGTSAPAPQQQPMTAGSMSGGTLTQPQGFQGGQVGQQQAGINPYLGVMANSIAAQSNDNMQRNIMPAIRGGAIANGGLGGSRQGVVEANALNDQNRNLVSSLSGLYGNAFESQQGRDLQRYGMDQNAGLATRGQDLQRYGMDQNAYLTGRGQDQNFYTAQRGQDFQGAQLGANLFQQSMDGMARQGQGLYQTGMQEQQAGFLPYQQFANLLGGFTGLNQTNTNSTDTSGNVVGGALAGGLTFAQLLRLFGGT